MKKKNFIVLLMLILALTFAGCGYNNSESMFDSGFNNSNNSQNSQSETIVTTTDRMIVYRVNLSITAEDKIESINTIKLKLKDLGGYEESYESYDSYIYSVLRVPTEKLDEFVNCIEGTGNVNKKKVETIDITEQYTSSRAKLESLKNYKQTLENLLNDATTITEKQNIQKEIFDVATKIDELEHTLYGYTNSCEYSTVYLSVYNEDEIEEVGFWQNLGDTFIESLQSVGIFLTFLLNALVAVFPYVVLCGIAFGIYVLIVFIVCKIRHKPFCIRRKHITNNDDTINKNNENNII